MAEFTQAMTIELELYVLPGSILASTPSGTRVLTVAPGPPNLDRLTRLETLADQVATGVRTAEEGLAALERFHARPERYTLSETLLAFALSSASAVCFFGGGPLEVGFAAVVGLLSGLLLTRMGAVPHAAHLIEVAAAAGGAFLLAAASHVVPLAGEIALVTGLIVLLPGFSLTVALTELATGHRVSGTTGLAAGVLVLLELGFGAALGARAAEALWGPTEWSLPAVTLPPFTEPLSLLGVAIGFSVLLQAPWRMAPQVLGACALALHGHRLASVAVGPEMAGGLAAFALTVVANHLSRQWRQPAAIWQVPGILLLVPGSIGFRSVTALVQHDVLGGVEAGFSTALACMALVGGTLLGSALVPPRTSL